MLFGLKNAGAIYQRLINKIFADQIRGTMVVYVDGMVTKTMGEGDHCKDLGEIFGQIKKFNMHLNLEKCALELEKGNSSDFC